MRSMVEGVAAAQDYDFSFSIRSAQPTITYRV